MLSGSSDTHLKGQPLTRVAAIPPCRGTTGCEHTIHGTTLRLHLQVVNRYNLLSYFLHFFLFGNRKLLCRLDKSFVLVFGQQDKGQRAQTEA